MESLTRDSSDDNGAIIERTYTAEFASGYRAELTVSRTHLQCVWTPKPPFELRGQRRRKLLAAYRAWRDESLTDFCQRTGLRGMVIDL